MSATLAPTRRGEAFERQLRALEALGVEVAGEGAFCVPVSLPVRSLSVSSIQKFERCREQWRAHYIERVRERPSIAMATGSAFGAAIAAYYQARIAGERPPTAEIDDRLCSELTAQHSDAEPRPGEDPAAAREGARAATRSYLTGIAARVEPVATERQVRFGFPGAGWDVVAYLDLETAAGEVVDLKLGKRHVAKDRPRSDLQASGYLLGRELEGAPAAAFAFHSGVLNPADESQRWRVLPTTRTPEQLLALQRRIAAVARQIVISEATGDWGYGPHGWWCGERMCANWGRCPAGGLDAPESERKETR